MELVNSEKGLMAIDAGNISTVARDRYHNCLDYYTSEKFKVSQENNNNHNSHHDKLHGRP